MFIPSYQSIFLRFFSLVAAAFLVGCSAELKVPTFSKPPGDLEAIVIRDSIEPKDVREIFRALNQHGELLHWKPFVEEATDEELKVLTDFFSRYFLQSASVSGGLTDLLEKRVSRGGISDWLLRSGADATLFPANSSLWRQVLGSSALPGLLTAYTGILQEGFNQTVSESFSRALSEFPAPATEEFSSELGNDIRQILHDSRKRGEVLGIVKELEKSDFTGNLVALTSTAGKEAGVETFQGLSRSLSRVFSRSDSNALQKLFRLSEILSVSGQPIVAALEKGLRENQDLVRVLSTRLEPSLAKGVSGFVLQVLKEPEDGSQLDKAFWLALPRKDLLGPPTEEFKKLFMVVLGGIQKISNPDRVEGATDPLLYNVPLILNSLAITQWLEVEARQNAGLINANDFRLRSIWDVPLEGVSHTLSLVTEENGKKKLSPGVYADLVALDKGAFANSLVSLAPLEGFGNTEYVFEINKTPAPLSLTLDTVVATCQSVRPLFDFTPFLTMFVQGLGSSAAPELFSFEGWKKIPNVMDALNRFVASLDNRSWTSFENILLDRVLANLDPDTLGMIFQFFDNDPKVANLIHEVLELLPSLRDLDDEAYSVFHFYHLYLRASRGEHLGSVSKITSALSRIGIFSLKGGKPLYPGLFGLFHSGPSVARTFYALSLPQGFDREILEIALRQATAIGPLGKSGWEQGYELLSSLSEDALVFQTLFKEFSVKGWDFLPALGVLSPAERVWLKRWVEDGHHEKLVTYLQKHSSREKWLGAMDDLETLRNNGSLERVFKLLGRIQDERMKKVARVFRDWAKGLEFSSFLGFVRLWNF